MNAGMLWFNNDAKLDLHRKVDQVSRCFYEKFGCKPTLCYIHPSMLAGRLDNGGKEALTIGEVELRPLNNVQPDFFWVTLNGKEQT
jgi:hypothetical protein